MKPDRKPIEKLDEFHNDFNEYVFYCFIAVAVLAIIETLIT